MPPAGIFFDLDGTLVDSAPELYEALRRLADEHARVVPPFERVRQRVSRGARAIIHELFVDFDDEQLAAMVPRYLDLYSDLLDGGTRPFDGVEELLDLIETRGLAWGVVTNKAGFLALPLLKMLGWDRRAAAVVCGDTLAVRKPHPEPLHHACNLAGVDVSACAYIGDDQRDAEAGNAAGMFTVAAAWGYLDGGDPSDWNTDALAATPAELTPLLGLA